MRARHRAADALLRCRFSSGVIESEGNYIDDWLIIYRSYTAEELAAEIIFLREEFTNPYSAQGLGSQSAQRDIRTLRERLLAATRVRAEMGGVRTIVDSVVDFSRGLNIR